MTAEPSFLDDLYLREGGVMYITPQPSPPWCQDADTVAFYNINIPNITVWFTFDNVMFELKFNFDVNERFCIHYSGRILCTVSKLQTVYTYITSRENNEIRRTTLISIASCSVQRENKMKYYCTKNTLILMHTFLAALISFP